MKDRHVIEAITATPWAIIPEMLEVIASVVAAHVEGAQRQPVQKRDASDALYTVTPGGVAVVPVHGVLVNHAGLLEEVSGAVSPQTVGRAIRGAMSNPSVNAVVLDIDSPGGQVAGVPEVADMIWEMRQNNPRPIVAAINGTGASAAYWIASQTDRIYATKSSIVGSIGVVTRIVDSSRYEKNLGLDAVVIRSGRAKAAGVGPLTDEQIENVARTAKTYFDMFVADVQRGRKQPLPQEVLTGATYPAVHARPVLVDEIATLESVVDFYEKTT